MPPTGYCPTCRMDCPLHVEESSTPAEKADELALDYFCPEGHFITRSDGPEESQRAVLEG